MSFAMWLCSFSYPEGVSFPIPWIFPHLESLESLAMWLVLMNRMQKKWWLHPGFRRPWTLPFILLEPPLKKPRLACCWMRWPGGESSCPSWGHPRPASSLLFQSSESSAKISRAASWPCDWPSMHEWAHPRPEELPRWSVHLWAMIHALL